MTDLLIMLISISFFFRLVSSVEGISVTISVCSGTAWWNVRILYC
jgi:hypothetical protein